MCREIMDSLQIFLLDFQVVVGFFGLGIRKLGIKGIVLRPEREERQGVG